MLTSITPLGERGRGNRWNRTATWLVLGHVVGGAALGVVLAAIGIVARGLGLRAAPDAALLAFAGAVVVAIMFDASGRRVPGRRQVDERWLTAYRGWVYGFGFGAQLGVGVVTVVNTALLGAVIVSGALVEPGQALAVGVAYGTTRGAGAVVSWWVRSVRDLHRLHRLLDRSESMVRWGSLLMVALVTVGAVSFT